VHRNNHLCSRLFCPLRNKLIRIPVSDTYRQF
jgi:hypothetical protein